jgi:hypothetical protein
MLKELLIRIIIRAIVKRLGEEDGLGEALAGTETVADVKTVLESESTKALALSVAEDVAEEKVGNVLDWIWNGIFGKEG